MGSLVTGLTLTYDVAANWKVLAENYNECYHCGPVHPELVRLVPAFGGGGTDLAWEDGIPHREGAWTFTMSGTTNRAPLPGLSEAEKVRHKGELVYPNLMLSCSADHVAAFVLRPLAVDRTRIDCSLLFARDAVAAADFDPSDAGDFWDLVNKQDWAICESVQRGMSSRAYTHGWFAPMEDDSADIRRWLLPRLAMTGRPMNTGTSWSIGLGALGSAAAMHLARRGKRVLGLERFELGHKRGASHDTSRILRHSYHTPAYVRLTQEAYDDWADLERWSGEQLVTVVGGLDLFPARSGDPDGRLHRVARRRRHRLRAARRRRDRPPLAAVLAARRHRRPLPVARCHRPRRSHHRADAEAGRRCRGVAARVHPGARADRRRRRRRGS